MHAANKNRDPFPSEPAGRNSLWWKEPYVWLVISGPVSAVLACAVTAVYIMQGPDALVTDDRYREGIEISKQVQTALPPMQPAITGRNHSATGGKSLDKP
jgi:uncharacterized protein